MKCAKPSAACSKTTPTAQLTGRRARDFATREYTTGVAARYLELLDQNSPQMRLGTAHWATREPICHDQSDLPRTAHEGTADTRDSARGTRRGHAACDVLFVLSSLAVGGSERKIARMANRLKEEGVP